MLDLAVVGGGPVGLATAIGARLAGLDVAVLERRDGPVDKACGEGLMPGALGALARLGVDPEGMPITGFRYADGRRSAEHRFADRPGRGVRRIELHRALAARAAELGVELRRTGAALADQDDRSVRLTTPAGEVRARWVVAADGLHSPVRRALGLSAAPRGARRYGLRRHWAVEPWSDLVEVHWLPGAELYVTPVAGDAVGVAVLGPPGVDLAAAIAACPAVAERIRGAEPIDGVRGAGPLRQRVRARSVGRVALVGDAAGYVDALTGEGLAVGLAGAGAAVAAIRSGDLAGYEAAWRRTTRVPRLLTEGVLRLALSPLRPAVVPLAAGVPALFGGAVELLAGVDRHVAPVPA